MQPAEPERQHASNSATQIAGSLLAACSSSWLEKIKTIGDAYMVAGGLPEPRSDHPQAVADLALAIREEIARRSDPSGQPLQVRIGIDTGPVVAGVIGSDRFSYDLWGDTVNTASRMESTGVPGCIQVTERTYRRLRDGYRFERRGPIQVKGKGKMITYFLVERTNDAAAVPLPCRSQQS